MLNKRHFMIAALLFMISISQMAGVETVSWGQDKSPQRIEPRSLNRMLENQEAVMLINTTGFLECMDARIPASVCVACDQDKDLTNLLPAKKDIKLVFYGGNVPIEAGCRAIEEAQRHGFTRIYTLRGGLPAWKRAGYDTESLQRIPRLPSLSIKPKDLETWMKRVKTFQVIDIRSLESFRQHHLEGALNIPMTVLHRHYQDIPIDRSLLLVDEDGSRSFLAASYLSRKGFPAVGRLVGGMEAWDAYLKRGSLK